MKPSILVTGANGQLGQMLQDIHADFEADWHFADSSTLDVTQEIAVTDSFKAFRATHCINCAAYTAVDLAESEQEKALAINASGAAILAKACATQGTKLLHISTDFVYSGEKSFYYLESDQTDPVNFYGASKLKGEEKIQEVSGDFAIFRTSWLYSEFGKNFVKTMLRLGAEKEEVSVVFDQVGTPTYARDLARLLANACTQEWGRHLQGIYHFSNEGVASWYDFAHEIFEQVNLPAKLLPIGSDAFPTPAQRPHFSVLGKEKIKAASGRGIRHWKTALADCMNRA